MPEFRRIMSSLNGPSSASANRRRTSTPGSLPSTRRLVTTVCLVLALKLGTPLATRAEDGTALSIDAGALEARRGLRSGHVLLDITGESDGLPYARRCETWFDESSLRCDVTDGGGSVVRGTTPEGQVSSSVVLAGGRAIRVDRRTPRHGGAYVITIEDFPTDRDRTSLAECPIDPRLLGMVPLDITMASMHFSFDDYVGRGDSPELTVGSSPNTATIRYDTDDTICEYVVAPDKGHCVTRIGSRHKESKGHISDVVVSDVELFGSPGVWFPTTVTYTRVDDDRVTRSEVVRVLKATFNEEIPPDVFTLAGMNAPPGRTVVVNSGLEELTSEVGTWDGSAIQPLQFAEDALGEPTRDFRRIASLVCTAIAAIWLAVLVLRKNHRSTGG